MQFVQSTGAVPGKQCLKLSVRQSGVARLGKRGWKPARAQAEPGGLRARLCQESGCDVQVYPPVPTSGAVVAAVYEFLPQGRDVVGVVDDHTVEIGGPIHELQQFGIGILKAWWR